jgi:hypothetical protein
MIHGRKSAAARGFCAAAGRAIAGLRRSAKIPCVTLRLLRSCLRRVLSLTFLAALSLLLGIGLGFSWVRSLRVADWLSYRASSGHQAHLQTSPGRLGCTLWIRWGVSISEPANWQHGSGQWDPQTLDGHAARIWNDSWLGFRLLREDISYPDAGWHIIYLIIPHWFPMVLTLIVPLLWLRRWRRRTRRVRLGLCLHCGYDLRATPAPSGPRLARCPECGRDA